mgnify:CR=1 FL=1
MTRLKQQSPASDRGYTAMKITRRQIRRIIKEAARVTEGVLYVDRHDYGVSVEDDNDNDRAISSVITMSIMKVLSKTSSWIGFIRSCGRKKSVSNVGIRRQITFVDSVWIVLVLMIPQKRH